ncbi:hypothetical protein B0H67DRAFT_303485 [Lasiosphaeris hirsuta]|uniref:Uncharacterized protein n=1 Tax=Lasiosphaeris hirsuta TaxID=260670 RepID=A0AA40A9U3_9PEZI|nr:hypothetical protein B0H67DRAFT_303485 [Lasiosphaeris hirsuta]
MVSKHQSKRKTHSENPSNFTEAGPKSKSTKDSSRYITSQNSDSLSATTKDDRGRTRSPTKGSRSNQGKDRSFRSRSRSWSRSRTPSRSRTLSRTRSRTRSRTPGLTGVVPWRKKKDKPQVGMNCPCCFGTRHPPLVAYYSFNPDDVDVRYLHELPER